MKAALILNPIAGRGRISQIEERACAVFREHDISCHTEYTEKPGDAAALARKAAGGEFDVVIAGGGDGTVNEVANGLIGTGIPLGILPIGTVNVLARELKIPLSVHKAATIIAEGKVRHIDLGTANGHCFTLMAGFGFDGQVVANVLQPVKDMIGSSAYVIKALETMAKYEATNVVLELPSETYSTKAFLIIVANVSTYTYNLKMAPYATPDDGLLDICVFERHINDRVGFACRIADVVTRRHLCHEEVKYFRAPKVVVRSEPEVNVQIDGDTFGMTPVEISVMSGALPVITPSKYHSSV